MKNVSHHAAPSVLDSSVPLSHSHRDAHVGPRPGRVGDDNNASSLNYGGDYEGSSHRQLVGAELRYGAVLRPPGAAASSSGMWSFPGESGVAEATVCSVFDNQLDKSHHSVWHTAVTGNEVGQETRVQDDATHADVVKEPVVDALREDTARDDDNDAPHHRRHRHHRNNNNNNSPADRAAAHMEQPYELHYGLKKWSRSFSVRMAALLALLLIIATSIVATSTDNVGQNVVSHLWLNTHVMKSKLLSAFVAMRTNHLYDVLFAVSVRLSNKDIDIEGGLVALLCDALAMNDKTMAYISLEVGSLDRGTAAFCSRYVDTATGNFTYVGSHSHDGLLTAGYVLHGAHYALPSNLSDPSSIWFDVPEGWRNVSARQRTLYGRGAAVHRDCAQVGRNGATPHGRWFTDVRRVHAIALLFQIQASTLDPTTGDYTADCSLYVKGRANAATFFGTIAGEQSRYFMLANGTLNDPDPVVYATSWGLQTVPRGGMLSDFGPDPQPFLTLSQIGEPMVRQGLRHMSLDGIADPDFRRQVWFVFRGVPSFMTVWRAPTANMMPAVLVLASSITAPGNHMKRAKMTFMALVILLGVLCVGAFWLAAEVLVSRPLRRMTVALRRNSERTYEAPMNVSYRYRLLRIREMDHVVVAFNAAMRQLRATASFLPRSALLQFQLQSRRRRVRDERLRKTTRATTTTTNAAAIDAVAEDADDPTGNRVARGGEGAAEDSPRNACSIAAASVRTHALDESVSCVMTVVYIRFAANTAEGLTLDYHDSLTVSAVASPVGNSGRPFPPPQHPAASVTVASSLCDMFELLIELVVTLSEQYGGLVHTLNPAGCVVHFRQHMSRVLLQSGSSSASWWSCSSSDSHGGSEAAEARRERAAAQDAEAAMRFELAMYAQLKKRAGTYAASVYLIADTAEFCCGNYYCAAVDQTVFLVTGRNVNWEFGTVLPLLGVHTVMTEETALRVRHCVRQLPLEAFSVRRQRSAVQPYMVVLYEALPGSPTASPWVGFANTYMDAFLSMLQARYNDALNLLCDLAPALPWGDETATHSSREEAEATRRRGGDEDNPAKTCSAELSRLLRECSRRVLMHDPTPYIRRPLHVDFLNLLSGAGRCGRGGGQQRCARAGRVETARRADQTDAWSLRSSEEEERGHFTVPTRQTPTGTAVTSLSWPSRLLAHRTLVDNHGTPWALAKPTTKTYARGMHLCLSPAGTLAAARIWPFRHPAEPGTLPDGPRIDHRTRFTAAAALLPCNLSSPYMVNTIGYCDGCEDAIAIVNEYCPGGSLQDSMARYGRTLPVPAVMKYVVSILLCLQYLHRLHIVHGRLCPKNVMVGVGNSCKLRGFFTNYTLACQVFELKKFPYLSPEVAAGAEPTAACDVYVVGLLLLELLTGHPPWRWSPAVRPERTDAQLRELLRDRSGRFAVQLRLGNVQLDLSDMPQDQPLLCDLLTRCLHADPTARITVAEALQLLASNIAPL